MISGVGSRFTLDRDPRTDRRQGEGGAEVVVTQPGESLQQGIDADEREHGHREHERPRVVVEDAEAERGGDEPEAAEDEEDEHERRRQHSRRNGAAGGAGVQGIDPGVEQAVRGHRDGTGGDHAEED
jgi:hypothetical protein